MGEKTKENKPEVHQVEKLRIDTHNSLQSAEEQQT